MDALFLKIMFDPLSYIDSSRLDSKKVSTAPLQAAVNRLIIDQYALPDAPKINHDIHTKLALDAWFSLRRLAYLLGARCLRSAVLQQIGYFRCDAMTRRFISLPLNIEDQFPGTIKIDEAKILRAGVDYIHPLFPSLPPAFGLRASLIFPAEAIATPLCEATSTPLDLGLIKLALRYAKST